MRRGTNSRESTWTEETSDAMLAWAETPGVRLPCGYATAASLDDQSPYDGGVVVMRPRPPAAGLDDMPEAS